MKTNKACSVVVSKGIGTARLSEELPLINRFTLSEMSVDQVYARSTLLAHSAIDRDRERFPEGLLDNFAATLPGKALLRVHDKQSLPLGLHYKATCESLTLDQFTALTGETPQLPPGQSMVKVLWGWFYMLKSAFNEEVISNIEAGIYRHVSIGFRAADLVAIKGQFGQTLYWEYVAPGEALEGSIVWLGAQPGAGIKDIHDKHDSQSQGEKNHLVPDDERPFGFDNHGDSERPFGLGSHDDNGRGRSKNALVPDDEGPFGFAHDEEEGTAEIE